MILRRSADAFRNPRRDFAIRDLRHRARNPRDSSTATNLWARSLAQAQGNRANSTGGWFDPSGRATLVRSQWDRAKGIQDQASDLRDTAMARAPSKQLVVCISNEGYAASLEKRKIYISLPDPVGQKNGLVRVIDESGDDYLYPKGLFRAIALPQAIKKAVLTAA